MKKVIIIVVGALLLGAAGAAGYYFYPRPSDSGPTDFVSKWDLIDRIEPVAFPMRDQTFTVPETEIAVVLNLVSSGDRRGFPMARAELPDGTSVALTAIDDYVSDEVAGKRVVLLRQTGIDVPDVFYLGIIRDQGTSVAHLSSHYVGEFIRPQRFEVAGDTLIFTYDIHDRDQPFNSIPRVQTSMTIDMANETVLVIGRNPKTEEVIRYKTFTGTYLWSHTSDEASERVEPVVPDVFTMRFNANRLELETDCNAGNTVFSTEPLPANTFLLEQLTTTSRFCESEQEDDYFEMINSIVSYAEDEDGTLTFELNDERTMTFVPRERALEFGS